MHYSLKTEIIPKKMDMFATIKKINTLKTALKEVQKTFYATKLDTQIREVLRQERYKLRSYSPVKVSLKRGPFFSRELTLNYFDTIDETKHPIKIGEKTTEVSYKILVYNELRDQIKSAIKKTRQDNKITKVVNRRFKDKITYSLCGGVHTEENAIIRLKKYKLLDIVRAYKTPKEEENHVAVEIECISKRAREEMELDFIEMGLENNVTTKTDGSIHEYNVGEYPLEIAILAPISKFPDIINKVTSYLNSKKVQARVNNSCGLHVHLDMRKRDASKVFHNFLKCQKIILGMMPKKRRQNTYCKEVPQGSDINELEGRYWAINPDALRKHKTIEIRAHTGSTNFTKIMNWVSLLNSIANYEETLERTPGSIAELGNKLFLSEELREYIKNRIEKFSDDNKDEEEYATKG